MSVYISESYFTAPEAEMIKSTIVTVPPSLSRYQEQQQEHEEPGKTPAEMQEMTIEAAIQRPDQRVSWKVGKRAMTLDLVDLMICRLYMKMCSELIRSWRMRKHGLKDVSDEATRVYGSSVKGKKKGNRK